jgi:hypothetical protein
MTERIADPSCLKLQIKSLSRGNPATARTVPRDGWFRAAGRAVLAEHPPADRQARLGFFGPSVARSSARGSNADKTRFCRTYRSRWRDLRWVVGARTGRQGRQSIASGLYLTVIVIELD